MSSQSAFSLELREADDGKRTGSATEPDKSRECYPRAGETCTSYNDAAAFATTPFEIYSFRGFVDRRRMAAGDDSLRAGCCERSNPAAEGFQRQIPASAKKGVCRCRDEI